MTPAFRHGFMDKLASIKSPEDLDAFYKKLKYRVLNKDTNRPYFNTNFETFDNWHLLSPEQIKKHKIGICYDTAAMTDAVLNELGIEHENRFAHSNTDGDWTQDTTHAYNIYKDKDGNWRWIEGSWGDYKGNDWKEKKKEVLLRKIKKALADAAGKKQTVHKVDKFPEPGIAMQDFYAEMLKNPVKKAELEKKADPPNRGIHDSNPFIRYANRHYGFVPQAPDSFLRDANSEDDFNRVTAEAIYNVGKENPDIEHSLGYDRNNALNGHLYDYFTASGSRHNTTMNWPGGILFGSYPSERKTVALHELGHGHDPILKKKRENKYSSRRSSAARTYTRGSWKQAIPKRSTIDEENYAWDWAGIPEDNPIRQAAMATYYNNNPGLMDKLHDKFWEEASKDGESWRSVDPSVNTNGVPMYSRIMDARAAGNKQLLTPAYPDEYIKYYPGIKQHLGEITRANDDLPPNKTHIDYPETEEHIQYNLSHIYPKAWMW